MNETKLSDMKSHHRRHNKESGISFGFSLPESSYIELRKIKKLTGSSMASICVALLQPEIHKKAIELELVKND